MLDIPAWQRACARARTFDENERRPGCDSSSFCSVNKYAADALAEGEDEEGRRAAGLKTFINEPPIQRLLLPAGAAIVLTHHPPPLWS